MHSINPSVCSATETALPPGVFITSTPAAVAAGRSTLSTPTPARPITFSLGAFASTSAFTFTALRTSSASASARCAAYSLGFETTTSQPGCAFNSSMPAAASGSATKIFICVSSRLRRDWFFFRDRARGVHALHRCDALAELHRNSVRVQDQLQLRHNREQVGKIEVPEMRDAENLPLHRSLTVGDDRAKAVAELLHDHSRIHALRRFDGGHRSAGAIRREQLQI